jgi:hypothetical protein
MNTILNKGEYYCTLQNGEFFTDVYKHAKEKYLYVVEMNGYKEQLTTVVKKSCYRKEVEELFFIPIANAIWDEHGVFEAIKRNRIAE